jgi:DNA-directed RNA polymerase subunit RPC12/RpoP
MSPQYMNKKANISKEERQEKEWEREDVTMLCPYILYIKKQKLGEIRCEECGSKRNLEIHHKRYGEDVAIKDLKLLCHKCHNNKPRKVLE